MQTAIASVWRNLEARFVASNAAFAVLMVILLFCARPALGVTTQSPEVRELIAIGAKTLSGEFKDERLGAKCLAALALHKAGQPEHPMIATAIDACRAEAGRAHELDMYSHGLAIIMLCDTQASGQRAVIQQYLDAAVRRQKSHGGWGYDGPGGNKPTGDTSQSQYIALAFWSAHREGYGVSNDATRKMLDWFTLTQDPSGAWGYQGVLGTSNALAKQRQISDTLSMAALGSLMIGADIYGTLQAGGAGLLANDAPAQPALPKGVRLASESNAPQGPRKLTDTGLEWGGIFDAISDGERWLNNGSEHPMGRYPIYRLYTLERYQSFAEFRDGVEDPEPDWYTAGYQYLKEKMKTGGYWSAGCGKESDTAFAMLFLLRSTQKSLKRGIGDGAMISGRGLPRNLAEARLERGQVVAQIDETEISGLLDSIDAEDAARLDELAANPSALRADGLGPDEIARFEQVLRSGEPTARLVAAQVLSRTAELDSTPALLYALTDPDRRVVLAARDALRAISRRPEGYGMPDNYDDDARYRATEKWKAWYLRLRPNASLDAN